MSKQTLRMTKIDFIPGLPPSQPFDETIGNRTNTVMQNSMPIVKIYPGIPSFTKGQTIYKRKDYFDNENKTHLSYTNLLRNHGFSLGSLHRRCLTLAYQADSFPTDTFSNEYGENFLQAITNVASTTASSIAQMFGKRTATEAIKTLTGAAKAKGGFLEKAGMMVEEGGGKALDLMRSIPIAGKVAAGGLNTVDALLAGSRLDFPMVWKSSGFQPSYTLTVRLYNPDPGSRESTHKYITGPIAAIMLLGIPISTDSITFSWPFIHKIYSPGIYDLDPAFISNITIIKGGDQQQISYKQRLGIVDIRIDFGSLFSTMLATKGDPRTRPTLKRYLNGISGIDSYKRGVVNFSTDEKVILETENKTLTSTAIELEPDLNNIKNNMKYMDLNAIARVIANVRDKIVDIATGVSGIGDTIENPMLKKVVKTIAGEVGTKVSTLGTTVGNISGLTDSITNLDTSAPLTFGKQLTNISTGLQTEAFTLKNIVIIDLETEAQNMENVGTQMGKELAEETSTDIAEKLKVKAEETRKENERLEKEALNLEIAAGEVEDQTPKNKQQTPNRVNTATKAKSEALAAKSPL